MMPSIKKINEFLRSHFLMALMGTAILGAFFPAQSQDMKKIVLFTIPNTACKFDMATLALFFLLFASSVNCRVRDFSQLAKAPRSFFVGLAQFYLMLPLLGWLGAKLGGWALGPLNGPQIGTGLALLALMPVAAISNLWVTLVYGNAALLLVFITLTTMLNVVVTPILLAMILGVSKGAIDVPRELMMSNLVLGVLFPLATGMFMSEFFGKFIQRHKDLISLFGVIGLHMVFFANAGNAIPILSKMSLQYISIVIGLTFGLNVISSAVAYFVGRRAKLPYEDLATVAVSGGMRSNGIALVIGMKTFPTLPLVTVPAAIYSFSQHIVAGQLKKILDRKRVAESFGSHQVNGFETARSSLALDAGNQIVITAKPDAIETNSERRDVKAAGAKKDKS